MRSVPAGSFERLSSVPALWNAWKRCRKGKRRQPRIAAFDLDADTHIFRLHRMLRSGEYRPSLHRVSVVHDPKTRLIAAPAIIDRVVHNSLLADIGPTYERGFSDQNFAVLTGRGPLRAALLHLRWMRRRRFRLALDVRRYFPSVHLPTLHALFARRLRDPETVELLRVLLEEGRKVYRSRLARETLKLDEEPLGEDCGLPLGGYLSHWSGGFYLDGLDHYVKRELKLGASLRYMDDIVLFHDEAEVLERAKELIADWLAHERRLTLKPRRDVVRSTHEPCTYLGFRISRAGMTPGPKTKRRLRRKLRQVDSIRHEDLVRSLRSYQGLIASPG